jgi:hypothetical protein
LLTSRFGLMGIDLSAPDHTTLSRRGLHLNLSLRQLPTGEGVSLIIDSTGLSVLGDGEWTAAKQGGHGKRGWKTLHLGGDAAGVILVHTPTEATVDDATTGVDLNEAVHSDLTSVTAGRGIRHGGLLRCGQCPGRDRRRATDEDGEGVSTQTAVSGARSDSHERGNAWAAPVEEGVRLPSAGPRRKRRLSVQVHHRRWSARS